MFDIGAGELLVIGIVALVVIGPKELPAVLRQVGKATGKMRQMASEFRSQFDEAMREAELQDAAKQLGDLKQDVIDTATRLNPVNDIRSELQSTTALIDSVVQPGDALNPPAPAAPSPIESVAPKPPEATAAAAKQAKPGRATKAKTAKAKTTETKTTKAKAAEPSSVKSASAKVAGAEAKASTAKSAQSQSRQSRNAVATVAMPVPAAPSEAGNPASAKKATATQPRRPARAASTDGAKVLTMEPRARLSLVEPSTGGSSSTADPASEKPSIKRRKTASSPGPST